MTSVFRCASCRHQLTGPVVVHAEADLAVSESDAAQYVPHQTCAISDGQCFTGTERYFIVGTDHRERFKPHPDSRRSIGCCGPNGSDGPNLVCRCGREVAILWADCWLPHAILLIPEAVLAEQVS
jgi:hypothetical protein